MDIRDLFKKQAEGNKEQNSKRAPVIIEEDDDDFKPSASKGGEGAKKSSQEGLKRKRGRARIRYESDSEEEGPSKKTKPSPKMGSGAARTDTKGQKRAATTPKRQQVISVSSFFGSAPVKRSSDFKNSKSTADGGDSKKDGGRKEKEGGKGKDTVICIPESPVDDISHRFDKEVISEELHEDKDFNKTLQELDQQDLRPSPSTSQVGPLSKKLKLMMEKLPVRKSPSKKTPTKSTNNGDSDFTDSPVWEQEAQAVRRSPRVKGQQRNGSEKSTPSKPSQLVKKVGETDGTGKSAATRGSKAKRGIIYYDSPSEEDTNVLEKKEGESESKPVSREKAKEVASPSKQEKLQPAASSPSKLAAISPLKPAVTSPLKPVANSPLKRDRPSSVPTKLSTTGTPKQDKSDTAASRKRDMASPVTPVPPKPSRSDSYRLYLNRSGPKAPGSKPIPEGEEDCLDGLTFVITGVLESMEREQASDLIKKYGGKVTGSVSKKTSYLVVGEDAGQSKLSKANQFGTKQINEDGLLDLIRTLPAKVTKKAAPPVKKAAPKKTAKRKSPTPFGVSEPLTPKSHPAPKSPVTTPTQSHASLLLP